MVMFLSPRPPWHSPGRHEPPFCTREHQPEVLPRLTRPNADRRPNGYKAAQNSAGAGEWWEPVLQYWALRLARPRLCADDRRRVNYSTTSSAATMSDWGPEQCP